MATADVQHLEEIFGERGWEVIHFFQIALPELAVLIDEDGLDPIVKGLHFEHLRELSLASGLGASCFLVVEFSCALVASLHFINTTLSGDWLLRSKVRLLYKVSTKSQNLTDADLHIYVAVY